MSRLVDLQDYPEVENIVSSVNQEVKVTEFTLEHSVFYFNMFLHFVQVNELPMSGHCVKWGDRNTCI